MSPLSTVLTVCGPCEIMVVDDDDALVYSVKCVCVCSHAHVCVYVCVRLFLHSCLSVQV